jgi:isopenicillin N synthase-like dioxygenase
VDPHWVVIKLVARSSSQQQQEEEEKVGHQQGVGAHTDFNFMTLAFCKMMSVACASRF